MIEPTLNQLEFLLKQFKKLTSKKSWELPSKFIERVRYLDKELTPIPGFYRFDNTPYWKEPLDLLSPLSDVQKVVIVKGVQVGFSTGVLENIIAYNIGADPKPQMFITADKELAKLSMEIKIERMIDSCGLRHLIFSQTKQKSKKTGDTIYQKQYVNGFLSTVGALNPGKLRAMSFPVIVLDELDAYPDTLKGEGDPVSLAENRSNAYGDKRKILYGSTPLILQSSKIWKLFLKGDQRYYNVPCKYCGEMQVLKWHGVTENGKQFGIVFEVENGKPIIETVGYKCPHCEKIMKNYDKAEIFQKGEWKSTAESQERGLVSYQLSALYSSPSMFSWENIVEKWVNAWDIEKNRLKDKEEFRSFRNLMQGLPYEEMGESIKSEKAQLHRRGIYLKNQIPNNIIINEAGSVVLFLTAAVDVQKSNIFVDITAWCQNGINYKIDFFSIDGEVEKYHSLMWSELDDILTNRTWVADDGKIYKIIQTVIDSGHYTQYVYDFCKQYSGGVHAIKGRDHIDGGLTFKKFSKETLDKAGLPIAYLLNTTKLKDHIAVILQKLQWNENEFQPAWYSNFPEDMRDDYFIQFESEQKKEIIDRVTNKWIRTVWVQTHGTENHVFDCHAYSIGCVEILADAICRMYLDLPALDWQTFWDYAKLGVFYQLPEKK
jgi:phage terminase large subunit GpA-like protein